MPAIPYLIPCPPHILTPPHPFRHPPPQLGSHPFFARMRGLNLGQNPVISKGREAAENIRERWETSDSPLVHRIQVGGLGWLWGGAVGGWLVGLA